MRWSIRSRLTTWYSLVVIGVLVTSLVSVVVVQERVALERFDAELQRLMLTLDGVMRNEFNEGLTLQTAADEASIEVLAPDRTLVLVRPDGELLAMWGRPIPRNWRPDLATTVLDTLTVDGQRLRVFSHPVTFESHQYVGAVLASLEGLESQQNTMAQALTVGTVLALLVASVGGWVVGYQTLKPLATMASQATNITEQDLDQRLTTPNSGDELGRFASAFNGVLNRLAAALHGQRQFMADASHELRTPVSVVRTTAQVTLARDQRSETDYREALTIVAEQSARLARLVDGMFLLSRAEARGLPLAREPLYLDDVVGDCARGLQVIAAERGVAIETTGTTETFVGDNTLLRQMVSNLLDNAIRHGRPDGRVAVMVTSSAAEIVITVRDDGPGIPADQHERIFERFARLDSPASGAGLGLPIARWIAEAHGGRLTLERSGPDVGTTFRVVLPLA